MATLLLIISARLLKNLRPLAGLLSNIIFSLSLGILISSVGEEHTADAV